MQTVDSGEKMFLFRGGYGENSDLYFFSIPLACALFLWAALGNGRNLRGGIWEMMAFIGRRYSLPVYILQCLVDELLFPLVRAAGVSGVYLKLHSPAVFLGALLLAVVYERIRQIIVEKA